MRLLDLFSGVGGLSIAVEALLGETTSLFCERDPYAQRVLKRHWPGVPILDDAKAIGDVGADVICGGPPCQGASVAGKQLGEADERWMWPEAVRITAANRPRLCLWENVPGLLGLDNGRAFGGILEAFDAIGYATRWDHAEAAAVGAPHRRDRVFLICVPHDTFTPATPPSSVPGSLFGHADEPEWPRAGWYARGRYGVETARFPRGSLGWAWPTPDTAGGGRSSTGGRPQDKATSLNYAVKSAALSVSPWATPTAQDSVGARNATAKRGPPGAKGGKGQPGHAGETLLDQAILWPTPDAAVVNLVEDTARCPARRSATQKRIGNGNGFGIPLAIAVRLESARPTPGAADAKQATHHKGGNPTLTGAARESRCPRPSICHCLEGGEPVGEHPNLAASARPTPRATEEKGTGPLGSASHQHRLDRGYLDATVQDAVQATGALNPNFTEWLMGLPYGWTEPTGPAMPHDPQDWTSVDLVYYNGRPAPRDVPLLTTEKTNRRHRLRCCGNAVVGWCAIAAFSALLDGVFSLPARY